MFLNYIYELCRKIFSMDYILEYLFDTAVVFFLCAIENPRAIPSHMNSQYIIQIPYAYIYH